MATVREDVNTDIVIKLKVVTSGIAFKVELSNYYTKEEVDALIPSGFITEIPSEYITESELNSKGYLTLHLDLSEYAKLDDLPTDYIKEIPSEYITETELNDKGYLTEHLSLEGYALKSELPSVEGLASEEWVNQQGYLKEHLSLANYALKSEIPDTTTLATKAELTTAIGNIDTILDNINGEVV